MIDAAAGEGNANMTYYTIQLYTRNFLSLAKVETQISELQLFYLVSVKEVHSLTQVLLLPFIEKRKIQANLDMTDHCMTDFCP